MRCLAISPWSLHLDRGRVIFRTAPPGGRIDRRRLEGLPKAKKSFLSFYPHSSVHSPLQLHLAEFFNESTVEELKLNEELVPSIWGQILPPFPE